MKYKKKPRIIEAIKWDGTNLLAWLEDFNGTPAKKLFTIHKDFLTIKNIEGDMIAYPGDYIIKGTLSAEGEYYVCKAATFEANFEEVGE